MPKHQSVSPSDDPETSEMPAEVDPATGTPPRVVLLTSPALFGATIINTLTNVPGIDIVGVGLTARVFKDKGPLATVRTLVQRTGWRYTFYNAFIADVSWALLRLRRRPNGLSQLGSEVRLTKDVNDAETMNWIRSLNPDYIASYYFNQWIGPDIRNIPRRQCVNMHPSLLPALRGPDPIFQTIQRELDVSGYTIHSVDDEFDTGRILYQQQAAVPDGVTHFELYRGRMQEGSRILGEWLAGRLTSAEGTTSHGEGDYSSFPTADEVRGFCRAGNRLMSWGEWRRALKDVR